MGKRSSKRPNKKRIKKYNRAVLALLITAIIVSILMALGIDIINKYYNNYKLDQGSPAKEFCLQKCGEKYAINSYNNTDYEIIKCV